MKKIYLLATALAALVSCTSEEYVGDQNGRPQDGTGGAIAFKMNTPAITRAEGTAAATALTNKFKVYGVKKVGADYSNVFATDAYPTSEQEETYDAHTTAYWVWYTSTSAGTTTSNTKDWEYVGTGGSIIDPAIDPAQTIKYWDYSADQYEFVAYSATVGAPTITKYKKDGFTVSATAAQLAGLYIADKLKITNKNLTPSKPASGSATVNQIGDVVRLTFRSSATKVRLGIYETIPGYVVKNVSFRPNTTGEGAEFTATNENAKLSGSFNGTSSSASATYNITYNSTTGIAEFDNSGSSSNYFDFGTFASGTSIGETSTAPTWATGTYTYQSVLPNTDNVGNMILYVNYELYNDISKETIHVYGAKAVIPSTYMKWNPNYAYTYLFKISDNTNGQTLAGEGKPVGLYPITFDAVTIAATDGQEVGTITTVSTPAITTYQENSVYDNVSESKHGITYAHANGPIYITVNSDGTLQTLTDKVKLYTVTSGTTEADLILSTKTKTEVTTGTDVLSILDSQETLQGITFAANTTAKFTPAAGTTYAVEYKVADAVEAVYGAVASGTLTKDKKYYTSNTGAGEFISDGTETSDGTNYFEKTTLDTPAVYQYKIIEVAAAPAPAPEP